MLDVACRAVVVRTDAHRGELAARFLDMDESAMGAIAQHVATVAAA